MSTKPDATTRSSRERMVLSCGNQKFSQSQAARRIGRHPGGYKARLTRTTRLPTKLRAKRRCHRRSVCFWWRRCQWRRRMLDDASCVPGVETTDGPNTQDSRNPPASFNGALQLPLIGLKLRVCPPSGPVLPSTKRC